MKSWPIYFFAQFLTFMFLFPAKQYITALNLGEAAEIESRWRKCSLFFSALPLLILVGTRYNVGVDYRGYSGAYMAISRYGLFEPGPAGYAAWLGSGFVFFCKLIAVFFGENFFGYHVVLAAITIFFLYLAVFENSKMPLLSLFIYLCDGYYYQLFNASRQGLAILLVFCSYKYIFENRFIPFALTVWAASMIHPSALSFLPAFFLRKKKFNIKIAVLFCAAAMFVMVVNWSIVEGLVAMTRYGNYMESQFNVTGAEVTILWFIYRAGIFGFCLFFRERVVQKYPNAGCLYMLCACSLVIQMISIRSYIFARLVLYYYIGMLLLIPYVVKSVREKDQKITVAALSAVFMSAHIYYFVAKADVMLAPVYRSFLWE